MTQVINSDQTNSLTVFRKTIDGLEYIGLRDNNNVLISPRYGLNDIKVIDDDNAFVRQFSKITDNDSIKLIYSGNDSLEEVVHYTRVNGEFVPVSKYPLHHNYGWPVLKLIGDIVLIVVDGRKLLYSLSKREVISPMFDEYHIEGSKSTKSYIFITIYAKKCDESLDVSPDTRLFTWCGEDGIFSHSIIAYTDSGQMNIRGCGDLSCSLEKLQKIIDEFINRFPENNLQYMLEGEEAK